MRWLVALLVVASPGWLSAQVVPEASDPLRPRMPVVALELTMRPPTFWQENVLPGADRVWFTGANEGGVFPMMELFGAKGELSFDEGRALFRSRVRARLLEHGGAAAELLSETERSLGERPALEQLFQFEMNGKRLSAVAWHFSSVGWNYTFAYWHEQAAFDRTLPLAVQVAESIELDREQSDVVGTVAWGTVGSLALMGGVVLWVQRARRKMSERDALPDVANLELAEAAKGSGGLSYGDDDGDLEAPVDEETGFKILDLSKKGRDKRPPGESS